MANARLQVDKALFTVLNVNALLALAPGGIFNTEAPAGVAEPFVVYQAMSKEDDHTFSGRFADMIYMVKAVAKSRWPKKAMDVDTQIDTLLEDATLSVTGFNQLLCRRVNDVYLPITVSGHEYQQVGGMYRIQVDQS